MATSKIAVSEGSGKNLATNSISEDAATKEIQRVVLNDSNGVEWPSTNDVHTALSGLSALNATQTFSIDGKQSAGVVITALGHASNVVTPYISIDDGVTWVASQFINIATGNTTNTATAAGSYVIKTTAAISKIQLKVTSWTSGTVTGTFTTSAGNNDFLQIGSFVNVLSAVNSSTANLTAGATFTGTYEADLHWQGVMISFFATQNCTITLEQSNDGVTVHKSNAWNYIANSTGDDACRAFNLVSNYHRVKVTNNGGSATTTLILNSYGIPNWSAEPCALTASGNKRVEMPGKATYSAATPASATVGNGVLFQLQGSATRKVTITKIGFSGIAGAAVQALVKVGRYTTAASSGTSATVTAGTHDTTAPAATAVCTHWTATGGTAGSLQSFIKAAYVGLGTTAAVTTQEYVFEFSGNNIEGMVLRGTSEYMEFSTASAVTGAGWFIEWTEE
jgi:hypothetical protein